MTSAQGKHTGGSLQQRDAVEGTSLRFLLQHRDAVESTNIEIKQLIAQDAPEGAAVSAREQLGGYGRQGRSWVSPRGGLYLSLLLRPTLHGVSLQELPTLSLALGLAVREVLASFVPTTRILLKWPNDVVCEQGKLCGISLEGIGGAACVGIGVNVFPPDLASEQTSRDFVPEQAAKSLPVKGLSPAYLANLDGWVYGRKLSASDVVPASHISASRTSASRTPALEVDLEGTALEEADLERAALEAADLEQILTQLEQCLLNAISRRYAQWCEGGFAVMQEEFEGVSYLMGKVVQVFTAAGDEMVSGQVRGVSKEGGLLVLDAVGQTHILSSGEAHIQFPNS